MAVRIEKATPADAAALTAMQVRAFDEDVRRYPGAPPGGPPGYDDLSWQLDRISRGHTYKILDGDELVGGAIVSWTGPASCELARIWIEPDRQGRGIGARSMALLEAAFPDATVWTLDTPAWATRNHAFYARRGYRKVREAPAGRMVLFYYEKRLDPAERTRLTDPPTGR
jgi:GNAT superfamily N-acetyltransferase